MSQQPQTASTPAQEALAPAVRIPDGSKGYLITLAEPNVRTR